MDNVVSCVHMGVQECVPSGEHLCVGAVHVPAVGSGLRVLMHGTCMHMCVHPSAVLQGPQCIRVRICSMLQNIGAFVRCHRERCVFCGFAHLCVCGSIFGSVQHRCVTAHLQSERPRESNAVRTAQTMVTVHVLHALLGTYRFTGTGSLSGWNSHCPSGSCPASPPGPCFSFFAFPQFPLLTGSSTLCPRNQPPHTNSQQGTSFLGVPCYLPMPRARK